MRLSKEQKAAAKRAGILVGSVLGAITCIVLFPRFAIPVIFVGFLIASFWVVSKEVYSYMLQKEKDKK